MSSQLIEAFNMDDEIYVVKIGGSITTNKDGSYELDYENINVIGKTLSSQNFFYKKLILVFGGGSFGNVAPSHYGILSRTDNVQVENISKMTTIMFSMLTDITDILAGYGLPVYPFQCSALVSQSDDGEWGIYHNSIYTALKQGLIPIISGDLAFKADGDFIIFSSDNVPELISKKMNVKHVLYYSDVDGLYSDVKNKTVISYIKGSEIDEFKSIAGPSSRNDVTGGMTNKIEQIQRLVTIGVTVEILSFRHFYNIHKSLTKAIHLGTFFDLGETTC